MIIDKIQKRSEIKVSQADTASGLYFVNQDAKSQVAFVAYQAIADVKLNPDDKIIVDVRILIERANT